MRRKNIAAVALLSLLGDFPGPPFLDEVEKEPEGPLRELPFGQHELEERSRELFGEAAERVERIDARGGLVEGERGESRWHVRAWVEHARKERQSESKSAKREKVCRKALRRVSCQSEQLKLKNGSRSSLFLALTLRDGHFVELSISNRFMLASSSAAAEALSASFSVTRLIPLPSGALQLEHGEASALKLENGGDAAAAVISGGGTTTTMTTRPKRRRRSSSSSPPPEESFLRCLLRGHPSRSGKGYKL